MPLCPGELERGIFEGGDRKSVSSPLQALLAPPQPQLPPPAKSFINPSGATAGRETKDRERKMRKVVSLWERKNKQIEGMVGVRETEVACEGA